MPTGKDIYISVIICTRNRGASLRHTLASLLTPSNLAQNDWKLIVVDNGSTDDTNRITSEYAAKCPDHVRVFVEPKAGKSIALNTGIRAARGEILAFTDDDAVCTAGYLAGVREVFEDPSIHVAAGATEVELPSHRGLVRGGNWLELANGALDCGDTVQELSGFDLWGVNTLLRRGVVENVGGFSPDLGPGSRLGRGEDNEFSRRVRRAGYGLFYAPRAKVIHRPARPGTWRSWMRRQRETGIAKTRYVPVSEFNPAWNPAVPPWKYKAYYARQTLLAVLHGTFLQIAGRSEEAMGVLFRAAQKAGYASELLRLRGVSIEPPRAPRVLDAPRATGETMTEAQDISARDDSKPVRSEYAISSSHSEAGQ